MAAEILREGHHRDPDRIRDYLSLVQKTLALAPVEKIAEAVEICDNVRLNGGCLYLCGNGGSAATASHLVCDLAKLAHVEGRRRLRAIALVDNLALLSAFGNDHGYATVFKSQVIGTLHPHDALIGISVSGASENVLLAMEYASTLDAKTIGVSGAGTERMRRAATLMIEIPGETMQVVEDVHMALFHSLALALRARQLS
jgi:D-sedoheptulose 7-phosphate isomerase